MKVKKVLCLMLSLVLAFGLSLTTLAAGEWNTGKGFFADPSNADQSWTQLKYVDGVSSPTEFGDPAAELLTEKYKAGFKVNANPTAPGDGWKFVTFKAEVDLDVFPLLNINIENASNMGLEVKVTRGNGSDRDYQINEGRMTEAKKYQINLQEAAKTAADSPTSPVDPDLNKTGEGKESFLIKLAFFPGGSSGAWYGNMDISELSITSVDSGEGGKGASQGDTGVFWKADFSNDGGFMSSGATTGKKYPLGNANGSFVAVPNDDCGAVISAKNAVYDDGTNVPIWQSLSRRLVVDIDKYPYLYVAIDSMDQGDSLAFKFNKDNAFEGVDVLLKEFTTKGTYVIDLKPIGTGVQTFYLNMLFVDGDKDKSETDIRYLYIGAKDAVLNSEKENPNPTPTPESKPWYPTFDAAGQKEWYGNMSGKEGYESLASGKTIFDFKAYGKTGVKLKFKTLLEKDVPWQFLSQTVTVDLDKYPIFTFDLESLGKDDNVGVKFTNDKNPVMVELYTLTAPGKKQVNLKDAIGGGVQTFTLYFGFVDSNRDLSEFVVKEINIDKVGGSPSTGQTLPVAATAVTTIATVALVSLVLVSKRKKEDTL